MGRVPRDHKDYDAGCRDNYPSWGFLGTHSVVRDLNVVSQALGMEMLNYYGISYGTIIGYDYLRTFPDDVDRMILESPVDPTVEEDLAEQLAAFNVRVEEYVKDCAEADFCSQGRTAEEVREAFLDGLRNIESPEYATLTDNGQPSERLVYFGMLLPLYSEGNPELDRAYLDSISAVINDMDARFFEFWGYAYESYDLEKDEFTTADDIIGVVTCLDVSDRPEDVDIEEEKRKDAEQLAAIEADAPMFYAVAFTDIYEDDRDYEPCDYSTAAYADPGVPDPLPEAAPVTNPGNVPVLLMGISGDTATPYEWAQTISGQLGVPLVTIDATGHALYTSTTDPCIQDVVADYLGSGEVPPGPVTCP